MWFKKTKVGTQKNTLTTKTKRKFWEEKSNHAIDQEKAEKS